MEKRKITSKFKGRKKVKWAVAGCGRFLENTFLPSLRLTKRSYLTSVYSHDLNRADFIKNKFAADYAFDDFDEFLKSDFNVIYISSVNSEHYEQVIKAAKAGKNILVEKPVALSTIEAEKMIEVCLKNKVFLSINYPYRANPLIKKAKEFIDTNYLGKLISISADFHIDFIPNENFRFKKELSGGGALWDLGPHVIDIIRYLGGEIQEVKGFKENVIYKTEVEDFSCGLLRLNSNAFGRFSVAYNAETSFNSIEILGHKGALRIDNVIGKKNYPGKLTINMSDGKPVTFRKKANNQVLLIKMINRSLLNNEYPEITGFDGLNDLKTIEQIEKGI